MALRDVRQLVREHGGQLVARRRHGNQPKVDADEAARQRERIDAAFTDQEQLERITQVDVGANLAAQARGRKQRLPDRLQVLDQDRVVQVVGVTADLAHDLLADLALRADAQVF